MVVCVMFGGRYGAVLGSVLNLNHPAHTVDWEFIHLSVANVVVIGIMLIVFALAVLLPFPGSARRSQARSGASGGAGSAAAPAASQRKAEPGGSAS
ncbi:MAG: hypothetical protein KGJ43_02265 [Acidobacteriota bacterium]|nr:hypothetical protein [Acidobacteriota bacterium]